MNLATRNRSIIFTVFSGVYLLFLVAALWMEMWWLAAIPFGLVFLFFAWQHVTFIFLLLLASLSFSAEVQISPSLGTDFPDELLMVLTGGLFLCYWIFSPAQIPRKLFTHHLVVFLFMTILWSVVTVIFSTDPLISLKYLLAKCWYLAAFVIAPLIVFKDRIMTRKAIIVLAVSLILVVIFTMIRHYSYDFSFAGVNDALKPFFRNHVNYSAMLVCMIPLFFIFFKRSRKGVIKNLAGIAIVVLLAALFFSYARGAWVALLVGIAAYWLIRKRLMLTAYIITLLIVIAALFWIKSDDRYLHYAHDFRTTIFHDNFREHLRATYEFKDVSTAERFYRWIAGVRMIKDKTLTGFGPSTFYDSYKPYAIPAFKTWVSNNPEHSTVHNYFLMITIEQGIPGLFFFLLLVGAMFFYAQDIYHRTKDPFDKSIAIISGVVLSMIMTVNFLSDLIETDKVGSLFFLCLSLLIVSDWRSRKVVSDAAPDIKSIP